MRRSPVVVLMAFAVCTGCGGDSPPSGPGPPAPPPPPPPPPGIAVGTFGSNQLNLEPLQDAFGFASGMAPMDPNRVVDYLTQARQLGYRVTARLVGGPSKYTDAKGNFDLKMWKERVNRFLPVSSEIQPFVDDGTLLGHMMLDDINKFDGRDPTQADLEEMALHSKSIWSNLATFVRRHATGMPGNLEDYEHLDGVWNQYRTDRGDAAEWAAQQAAAARAAGLAFINGLNILGGGDGSSGIPGPNPGTWSMSATELRSYAAPLLAENPCLFMVWTFEESYFDRPAIGAAVQDITQEAAQGSAEASPS